MVGSLVVLVAVWGVVTTLRSPQPDFHTLAATALPPAVLVVVAAAPVAMVTVAAEVQRTVSEAEVPLLARRTAAVEVLVSPPKELRLVLVAHANPATPVVVGMVLLTDTTAAADPADPMTAV